MLLLLIIHIIITACCLWSGFLLYNFFQVEKTSGPIIYYLISGLILLTSVSQIIVLFSPINLITQIVFAFALTLSIIIKWRDFKFLIKSVFSETANWPLLSIILFLITWGIILLMNAGPVIMDDTESYHIQMVKWIQEYGSVPGLVNLHERFGFNSSWFSSIALFNFSSVFSGSYTLLNSVLSLWLCYWMISKCIIFFNKENPAVALAFLVVFGCCLIVWPLIRGNAATANYDFITTAVILILFIESLLIPDQEFSPGMEWMVWPVYLFTVRVINFPFLLLSLIVIIFFTKQKKIRSALVQIGFCLLLIIPFLARNIIISGLPFYPSLNFDWFGADWKPDPQLTDRLLEYIKYYNRVPTTWLDIEQTKSLGSNWIPAWFHYLFIYDKILVTAGGGGLLLGIIRLFYPKQSYSKKNIFLLTVCIVTLFCWLIISPDPRFVYGILLFGLFILALHLFSFFKYKQSLILVSIAAVILLIGASGFYLISKSSKQVEYRNWILPAGLPKPPVREVIIDGIKFNIPEPINNNWNPRCYGSDLPCLYKIDPRLKPRGENIRDGFRIEK